jgi:putative hydrolase of the HAD superfamily
MYSKIKVISFDADDTLWVNEPFYRETETEFCKLLSNFHQEDFINKELLKTEIKNLEIYGYGAKGFILSLIETANRITKNKVPQTTINSILDLGKQLLNKPVELIDGIEETLKYLSTKKYKIIVATKGDLLDQERKLAKSNLAKYFHHIDVMSDKKEENYAKLLKHHGVKPNEFLMVGNSLRSDILPVINLGAKAIYVPFHTTWIHEEVAEKDQNNNNFIEIKAVSELKNIL